MMGDNFMINNNNVLRELIDNDQPTVGTHMYSPWPGMVEVIGHTGAIDLSLIHI